MKKILVSGVNGFVGKHLVRELTSLDYGLVGVGLQPAAAPEISEFLDDYHSVDLTDPEQVASLPLESINAVISLAGLAVVGKSQGRDPKYDQINVGAVTNVAEVMLQKGMQDIRHIAISTSMVYDAKQSPPFSENSKLISANAPDATSYSLSKLAMEKAVKTYRNKGLDIVIARPFNHIGPGQELGFILPDLFSQARTAILERKPILVGNLETRRDYTDVRDVASAYAMLVRARGLKYQVYNICSGRAVSGQEILRLLLKQLKPSRHPEVVVDPSKFRPSDAPAVFGTAKRLESELGWKPKIPIRQTITDFVGPVRFGELALQDHLDAPALQG